ncbi:MAG: hypothetical protein JSV88_21025 [Candidatus Aminicenantes bacterium]|nr:MAG: hypothetical protein JSV88_21025 [Candidatus Aminicenantes bacterium]
MSKGIEITVRNQLVTEKRSLNVYHHSSRSAYMISHGNSITIPLETSEDVDYLHLSIVSGPGSMEKDCWLYIPSWCDFTISSIGNGDLTHSGDRMLLKIPPGPPVWQLKITRPIGSLTMQPPDHVTIGDGESVARG